MIHAAPNNLQSRWVENSPNTLRSYGIALCVAIAFLLFIAKTAQPVIEEITVSIPSTAAQLLQKINVLPAVPGGGPSGNTGHSPGEGGIPKPKFQLVVPVEPNPTETVDWGEENNRASNTQTTPGNGSETVSTQKPPGVSESETPDPDETFTGVEQDPSFSMDALRAAVRYPEVAVRMHIEGKVIVKAYINADGSIREAHVATSDNALLNNAALQGVRQIRYEPAKQNSRATGCWIYIPVSFELKN